MFGGFSGYQGANTTGEHGYVYWPSLDPTQEAPSYTRHELSRRTHALYANVGLPRRIVNALTYLTVGTGLWPTGITTDHEWNTLARQAYADRGRTPRAFDWSARHDSTRAQRLVRKGQLVDGDSAVVFAREPERGTLRRAFFGGWQIHQGGTDTAGGWRDGLKIDERNRIVAYRFPGADGKWIDVPADHACLCVRHESLRQDRGVSVLAHAAKKMIQLGELNSAIMQGIIASHRQGYYITEEPEQTVIYGGIDGALRSASGQGVKRIETTSDGKKIALRDLYGSGGYISKLSAGQDIKMLLDERPSENTRAFEWDMIRDICWGADLSPELAWNIAALGGANTRFVMADAQSLISSSQHDLIVDWLYLDYVLTIQDCMREGTLRACRDERWWAHGWITPARVTVDFSKDGQMHLSMIRSGMMTLERWHAMQGQDAEEELIKQIEFFAMLKRECAARNLTVAEVFPGLCETSAGAPIHGTNGTTPSSSGPTPEPSAPAARAEHIRELSEGAQLLASATMEGRLDRNRAEQLLALMARHPEPELIAA